MRLPITIDPKDPKRVLPANAESAKRVVLTGSRIERRMMKSQLRSPRRVPKPATRRLPTPADGSPLAARLTA